GQTQLNDRAAFAVAGVAGISKKVCASVPVRGDVLKAILFASAAVALGSVKRLTVQPFFAYTYAISTLLVAVATVAPDSSTPCGGVGVGVVLFRAFPGVSTSGEPAA
ncbi:hypothetical protein PMAYCL1PPCAC_10647, partial [Pristionchus mayeri]